MHSQHVAEVLLTSLSSIPVSRNPNQTTQILTDIYFFSIPALLTVVVGFPVPCYFENRVTSIVKDVLAALTILPTGPRD